jgi:hypothetical protein
MLTAARVAFAAMALHVLDDSFVQPQPGTGITDHLVSGLVPLAGLAAAAWALPRLQSGARAVLALLLAPFAVVLGAEAIHYWGETGLSGDDYTGLLCVPAGLTLFGVAGHALWASRRTDDSRWWRYPRRALLVVVGLLSFMWVVFPFNFSYGVTHITRGKVPAAEMDYERVTLHTRDGLDLAAWHVPSRNGASVLVYPGRGSAQKHARYLVRAGYGVLMMDRRGEGASEGDPIGFGWTFGEDIRAGVAFLEGRGITRIAGLGLSVGGEMMLQTAASEPGLDAIVSDGAGSRVMSEEFADLHGFGKYFSAPLLITKTASVALFANATPPSNLVDYIARIGDRPIMVIHARRGEVDDKSAEYMAAARGPVTEWEVPRGGHTAGIRTMPDEYARRVLGFLERSL